MKTLEGRKWKYRSFKAMLDKYAKGNLLEAFFMQNCKIQDIPQSAGPVFTYRDATEDKQILGLPLYWRKRIKETYFFGYKCKDVWIEGCLFAFRPLKKTTMPKLIKKIKRKL